MYKYIFHSQMEIGKGENGTVEIFQLEEVTEEVTMAMMDTGVLVIDVLDKRYVVYPREGGIPSNNHRDMDEGAANVTRFLKMLKEHPEKAPGDPAVIFDTPVANFDEFHLLWTFYRITSGAPHKSNHHKSRENLAELYKSFGKINRSIIEQYTTQWIPIFNGISVVLMTSPDPIIFITARILEPRSYKAIAMIPPDVKEEGTLTMIYEIDFEGIMRKELFDMIIDSVGLPGNVWFFQFGTMPPKVADIKQCSVM